MNSKIKLNLTFEVGFLHLFIFGFVKWGRVVSFRIFRTRNFETGVGRPVLLAYEMIDFVFRYEFCLYYLFGRDPEGRAISSNKLKISHSRGECRIFNTRFYPSRKTSLWDREEFIVWFFPTSIYLHTKVVMSAVPVKGI